MHFIVIYYFDAYKLQYVSSNMILRVLMKNKARQISTAPKIVVIFRIIVKKNVTLSENVECGIKNILGDFDISIQWDTFMVAKIHTPLRF